MTSKSYCSGEPGPYDRIQWSPPAITDVTPLGSPPAARWDAGELGHVNVAAAPATCCRCHPSWGLLLKMLSLPLPTKGTRLLSLTVLRGNHQQTPRQHSNGPVRVRAGQRAKSQGAARWRHPGWRDSCRKPVRCVLGPARRRGNCATRWRLHCGVARTRFPPAPGRCSREAARDLVEGLP